MSAGCMTGNDHSGEDLCARVSSQLLPRHVELKQNINKNIFYLHEVKILNALSYLLKFRHFQSNNQQR
jgi:hypothetical protein